MNFVQNSQNSYSNFFTRVYAWMAVGLGITGSVGYAVSQSSYMQSLFFGSGWMIFLLIIAQLGLVIALSAALNRMNYGTALLAYLVYSALSGITFSSIFMVYTLGSIAMVFGVTASMFAVLAVYGLVTKRDLSGLGSFMIMVLWGLIIGLVVNMFLRNSSFDLFLAWVGVFVFAGLIAFDMQKIRIFAAQAHMLSTEDARKYAVVAALVVYLDFVNLFLSLLRIFGNEKE